MKKNDVKHVFRYFDYGDADAFAQYLRAMAAKGWFFRGWHLGLEFEKGSPADEDYAVEVFDKGKDQDPFPAEDGEEFADYCQKAGWEYIDGFRKFLVFRRMRADAPEIRSPEERFAGIRRQIISTALVHDFLYGLFMFLAWGVFQWYNHFTDRIFSNIFIIMSAIWSLYFLAAIFRCLRGFVRIRRSKRTLEQTGETWFGGPRRDQPLRPTVPHFSSLTYGLVLMLVGLLVHTLTTPTMKFSAEGINVVLILWALILGTEPIIRPKQKKTFYIAIGVLAVLLIGGMIISFRKDDDIVTFYVESPKKRAKATATAATFPLTFEDLGIEHPSIESVYHDRSASFLASMESWRVSATEFVPEIDRTVPDLTILDYEVYRSEFEWILKKIVEEKKNILYEDWSQARDVSAAWNAEEALQRTSETGEVKIIVHRGKSVLLIYVNHVLTQEQIQMFIDKLGV